MREKRNKWLKERKQIGVKQIKDRKKVLKKKKNMKTKDRKKV